MISLRKFLGGSWETVREYLQSDLEAIETSFNTLQANAFNEDGTLAPSAFPGESDAETRYVANTGVDHAPKWDQVELSNGVKGRLPFANIVPASRGGILVGRQNNIRGDFGEIYLGVGLRMSGNVLEAVPAPPAASPDESFATGGIPGPKGDQGPVGPMGPPGRDGIDGESVFVPGGSGSGSGSGVFTPGSVLFAGASGAAAQDNASFFWDDTLDQLQLSSATGIGLKITQTSTFNSGINLVRSGGTASDWLIYLKPSTTSLAFFSGSDRVTFSASGEITYSQATITGVAVFGTNPASVGTIRIPNNVTGIAARNAANSGDVGVFTVDASDNVVLGFLNAASVVFKPNNTEQAAVVAGAGVRSIAAGAFYWTGRAVILSPADAQLTITNQAQSSGFGLQASTADTMIVANKAQSAYGTVDAKFSAQGTPGVATFGPAPVASITVKDGIITAIS